MKLQIVLGIVLMASMVHALGGKTEGEIETQSSVPSPQSSGGKTEVETEQAKGDTQKAKATTQNSELKTQNSPYTAATLPNGVTVELLGLCEHPSFGKQWWLPDGDLLEESPYDNEPYGRAFPKWGESGYKFAVKLSGMAYKDVEFMVIPSEFIQTQRDYVTKKNGKENTKHVEKWVDEKIVAIGASFVEESESCDIEVGVCFGKWRNEYRYEDDKPNDAVEWVKFENVLLRPNFDQYAGLSKKEQIIRNAESQARLLNHEYVGTEHILLGLIADKDRTVSQILNDSGITGRQVYDEILRLVKKSNRVVFKENLPMTDRAKLTFKNATQLAKESNSDTVNSIHVLLGLLQVEEAVGAQVLINSGLNFVKAQEAFSLRPGGKTEVEIETQSSVSSDQSSGEKTEADRFVFAPTVEITINDAVSVQSDSAIDFDTGKLFSLPDPDDWVKRTPEEAMQWITDRCLDASGASRDTIKGLMCEDMVFASMNNSYWDSVKAMSLAEMDIWEVGKPGRPSYMTGKGQLPATYIFKTREGGIGVLQILGFSENPNGIKIRYKMLQNYDKVPLRPGEKPEVEIETRILLVTENFLEDIGLDVSLPTEYKTSGGVGEIIVGPANSAEIIAALEHKPLEERELPELETPTQKFQTLDDLQNEFLLRATQAHSNAKQLQAPKVIVLNNESATIQIDKDLAYIDIDEEEKNISKGLILDILPTMQDDGKEVLLKGHMQLVDVLEMQEYGEGDKAYSIPIMQVANIPVHAVVKNGGTILIEGPELRSYKKTVTNPGLREIPIVGRHLSNVSIVDERYRILVLIKPMVIERQEVEADAIGQLSHRSGKAAITAR